jgi:hypothetical protein
MRTYLNLVGAALAHVQTGLLMTHCTNSSDDVVGQTGRWIDTAAGCFPDVGYEAILA